MLDAIWRVKPRSEDAMDHCILVRFNNGTVVALTDEDGSSVSTWPDLDAAIEIADKHPLCKVLPYQIVCLDEL